MPNVYKFNLEQADFPYEQEDYGTLSGSVSDTVDYGEGLPVQNEPDYSTDLYYPLDATSRILTKLVKLLIRAN